MPMLKLRIGGTEGVVAKNEEARRMVPSPPKVAVRSTLLGRAVVRVVRDGWVGGEGGFGEGV